MSRRRTTCGVAGVLLLAGSAGSAWAHKPSDSYLSLDVSRGQGRWDIALRDLDDALTLDHDGDGAITWGETRAREADIARYALDRLTLAMSAGPCPVSAGEIGLADHSDGTYASLPLEVHCSGRGRGTSALIVDYRLLFDIDAQHQGLVRLSGAGDSEGQPWLFTARDHVRTLESFRARSVSFVGFVRAGVRHIWTGLDHILFLLVLLVPAVFAGRGSELSFPVASIRTALADVVRIVTSFTAAHSLTLSLAALGVARMPARLTEPAIAASVVLGAINNVRPLFGRDRWVVTFSLGLLHGFGFSSVLTDTGLAGAALLPALAGFNLGVEVGQLAIVALFVPIAFALRGTRAYRLATSVGSTAVAFVATAWFFERALAFSVVALVRRLTTPG